jgi:hypothetical protein
VPLGAKPDAYVHPRLSPDGRRLAVVARGDIYVADVTTPRVAMSRLTHAFGLDWFPVWTPDSRRLVFGSWRDGTVSNLYVQDVDGGSAERLTGNPDMQLPTAITPDGSAVLFHSPPRNHLYTAPVEKTGPAAVLFETAEMEVNGVISPDGRWLAYEGENAGRPGLRPFRDPARGVWQVSQGGGMYPVWAPGNQELFYVKADGTLVAVPFDAGTDTWRAGAATDLFRGYFERRDGSLARNYDVAPDGRFLILKDASPLAPAHFVIVQNWFTELRRLVP